ncbi:hypothetical protein [Nitrosomonas ureae]|uniref:Ribbon-helix-helix protein, copG family n=1 Tax=Nitrosomonas ureae TaxID=44577 RepID=A0A286A240_9PROT|nr:hypothetical protein [Nitrosomonas ureae]SOD15977.1 hypothetical protein SAMN06297164_0172 [Nitrosomonas ureae]
MIEQGNAMSMFGKCTEEVKTRVSYATKEALQRLAHDAQMSESEYLRTILMIHVHGEEDVHRLHQERINKVVNRGK